MQEVSLKNLMILVLLVLLVVGVVLTGGCASGKTASQETPTQILENVTPKEAFTLIQGNRNNPDFIILDVRTPEEVTDGYIEGVTNIDFYAETFQDKLNQLDKNQTYLVYCHSGNRSGNTLNIMAELNFGEVYNISGGIIGWQASGLPTVK